MGNKFSEPALKTRLKLCVGRINLIVNKRTNEVKSNRRKVAELLHAGKDENARIRVEGVIRDQNHIYACERLSLHVELLLQRTSLIAQSK